MESIKKGKQPISFYPSPLQTPTKRKYKIKDKIHEALQTPQDSIKSNKNYLFEASTSNFNPLPFNSKNISNIKYQNNNSSLFTESLYSPLIGLKNININNNFGNFS